MEPILQLIIAVITSVLASSGVWTLIMKRMEKKDNKTKLLLGIAQNLIIERAEKICSRGKFITEDEYSEVVEYLYKPYAELGGNGVAKRWVDRLESLKIVPNNYTSYYGGGWHVTTGSSNSESEE